MKIAQNAGKETLTMLIVVLKQEVRITMPESKITCKEKERMYQR